MVVEEKGCERKKRERGERERERAGGRALSSPQATLSRHCEDEYGARLGRGWAGGVQRCVCV